MRTKINNKIVSAIVSRAKSSSIEFDEEKCSELFIPTGSTLFNLALSDKVNKGFNVGKIVNLIGDSSSGKTFIALSCFAEMAHNDKFKNYEFIYDDAEHANEFNLEYLFGERTAKRIKEPVNGCSNTIEDFRDNILKHIENKKPFLYILDSFDALTSDEELRKIDEQILAREKGNKITGTYGMEKAKGASQILRVIKAELAKTNSALIVISQTRDNIGLSFAEKTRSGGKALKFYSTHEIWTAHLGFIKKKINDKERKIGIQTRIKITKNKITGKINEIDIPIFYDYGIDDIRANIEWLIKEGFWESKGGIIHSQNFSKPMKINELIHFIEQENKEIELKKIVGEKWENIQESLKLNRKRKYS